VLHGDEPLDTDTTPTLEGEAWLMHRGYAQAEGAANGQGSRDRMSGFHRLSKIQGGTGGYARYVAICPADWKYGASPGTNDAPLPKSAKPLHWNAKPGMRVR
jgi:hypothetical protein